MEGPSVENAVDGQLDLFGMKWEQLGIMCEEGCLPVPSEYPRGGRRVRWGKKRRLQGRWEISTLFEMSARLP